MFNKRKIVARAVNRIFITNRYIFILQMFSKNLILVLNTKNTHIVTISHIHTHIHSFNYFETKTVSKYKCKGTFFWHNLKAKTVH